MGMTKRLKRKGFTVSAAGLLAILSLLACGSLFSEPIAMLPRNVVVPLSTVKMLFPEIVQESDTGTNLTAAGIPKASRSVTYTSKDVKKKITITVDQYESPHDTLLAYEQAIQKSKLPEFQPLSIPNLGEQSFAGTVTRNAETHIGLGVLDGVLVIGVTLSGYDVSSKNIASLVALAEAENAAIRLALTEILD